MADELIWVAQRDGETWNSSRTRDVVDFAFSVKRETGVSRSIVTIRQTYTNHPSARAVYKVGRLYFSSHKVAKAYIEEYLKEVNAKFDGIPVNMCRDTARAQLMYKLLDVSEEYEKLNNYGSKSCYVNDESILYGKKDLTDLGMKVRIIPMITPTPPIADTVSPMAEAVASASEAADKAFDITKIKHGDPAPLGYIWIGKTLTKIGWPS